ncbi:hypothetical protein ANCDUO_24901 [Ancylostoma duodenale]|uniref:Kinesin motor domain-containing protein n=1 Tax=Ancylostoma duodenale TaxID=51022 RepID=A0A0C2FEE3_9BILA|nr:hypothetical protein ANCDUO_24901 [Ancylostoma duodenale]
MISPGMSSCEHTINTLRYADRVKELGADEGGSSPPMNDEELMLRAGGDDGDNEDADLSLGTDKTTFDMMKIVSSLTAAEEDALYSQYNLEQAKYENLVERDGQLNFTLQHSGLRSRKLRSRFTEPNE